MAMELYRLSTIEYARDVNSSYFIHKLALAMKMRAWQRAGAQNDKKELLRR